MMLKIKKTVETNIKNNLHIVVLSELYNYGGGIETWIDYFLKGLAEKDKYNMIYIYCINPVNFEESLSSVDYSKQIQFICININYKSNGKIKMLHFNIKGLLKILKKLQKNDIVICVGSIYTSPIGLLLKLIHQKDFYLITWIRSISSGEMKAAGSKAYKMGSILEKILLKISDKIITNGSDTYNHYNVKFPLLKEKCFVIENAVEKDLFYDVEMPKFEENQIITVGFIGRLSNAKGFTQFMEATDKYYDFVLGNKTSMVKFNIYGHGENEHLINDKKINYHGKFEKDKTKDILQQNDIVVFLNQSNFAGGISHGMLEAMAAGRLVVAWDNVIHNQVLDDTTAILIEEGNVRRLASFFNNLNNLNQEEIGRLKNKCINARKKSSEYSIKNHIKKYLKVSEFKC